ncbi:hypothetical protein, partial [Klebsiella pneumoniae]|uniref:hypothetical protein n=1 Tax=Klebsiella pneumoniae TaxID=573 RepID=UPI00200BE713
KNRSTDHAVLFFNYNNYNNHKYIHMQIDISDTPPGIPQLKVNPKEIYINLLRKKRTNQPARYLKHLNPSQPL